MIDDFLNTTNPEDFEKIRPPQPFSGRRLDEKEIEKCMKDVEEVFRGGEER